MHGDAVLRVTEQGDVSTVVEIEQPSGLVWLPDGSLLICAMARRCVMRVDGSRLLVHADLSSLAPFEINDMCVDRNGHAFVGQFGYDMWGGGTPAEAPLLRVDPDGTAREVADDLRMANGMVIAADQSTLLVAESWGKRITGFDLANDGALSNRRVWADLDDYPDGIGIDADDGVWVASPVSDRFTRVVGWWRSDRSCRYSRTTRDRVRRRRYRRRHPLHADIDHARRPRRFADVMAPSRSNQSASRQRQPPSTRIGSLPSQSAAAS